MASRRRMTGKVDWASSPENLCILGKGEGCVVFFMIPMAFGSLFLSFYNAKLLYKKKGLALVTNKCEILKMTLSNAAAPNKVTY